MSQWPSTKAGKVLKALLRIGWTIKRETGGSHRTLARPGWRDYVFSFHDAEAIELLYRELVSDASIRVLPEHVAALAESPSSFLMVGCSSGMVCATALLTICPDVMYQRQPFGLVENLIVAERHRGAGIGRQLMDQLEGIAREHLCTKLMLLSASHRHPAHRFFEAVGFEGSRKLGFVKYASKFRRG